jgi:PST family polysaccharide transporter
MSAAQKAAHGLFWSVAERLATQGISFAVVLLLARLLGPHSYGLVTLAATIALFGQMLLGETFTQALIQEKTLEPAHVSSVFWLLAGLGVLAAGGQFAAADVLANVFGQREAVPILRALSPLLLLAALQAVPNALLRRALDFRAIFAASSLGTLVGGVLGVGLALAGFGVWSLVANLLAQNTILAGTIWRRSSFRPVLIFSQPHLGALWSYGRYTLLLRIAAFIANQSPRLIVGYLFGAAALGAFSLGLRIVEMLAQLLVIPAANVIVPTIARIRDTPARVQNAILSATQMTAMAAVPVYCLLALTAPIAVPLIFGAKWLSSVVIVQLLSVYGIVAACGQIWQAILGGLGRPDIALRTTLAAAFASVAALVLTARFGPLAAAGAFVFRGYVTLPFLPLVIAWLTGLPAMRQYRAFLPVAVATLLMAGACAVVMDALGPRLAPPLLLAVSVAAGALVYGVAIFALDRSAVRKGLSFFNHLQPRRSPA